MNQGYLFAHRILPDLVFSEPEAARIHLEDLNFLRRLWVHGGMHATGGERRPFSEQLQVTVEGHRTVITLPAPQDFAEAFFVAVDWKHQEPKYYTLELGEDSNYLCGWGADGSHHNYSDGFGTDLRSFLTAIDEH
jgi:hypothetical protein